jgi:hypothetical protein
MNRDEIMKGLRVVFRGPKVDAFYCSYCLAGPLGPL